MMSVRINARLPQPFCQVQCFHYADNYKTTLQAKEIRENFELLKVSVVILEQ